MLSRSLKSHSLNVNLLTCAPGVRTAGPNSAFSPLNLAKLCCNTHGLRILMKGPAAGLQMAVCIDKAVLLPRPCDITQTLSPLPTKIHLFSRANLRIHHLDTCIETMTIMTARDGSQNNAMHVWTGNFCPKINSWKWSCQQKLYCRGTFNLCSLHIYTKKLYIRPSLFCKLDDFNEATEEFLLLNFLLW